MGEVSLRMEGVSACRNRVRACRQTYPPDEAQLRGNVRSQAQLGNEGSRNGDDDAVEAFGEGGAGALSGAEWAEGVDDGAEGAGAGDFVE